MKALALLLASLTLSAQDAAFLDWMNNIAQRQLRERAAAIAAIKTTPNAEARKNYVRSKVMEIIGGLPTDRGPLNPRVTGTVPMKGYEIRKVIFDSLPGIYVTANLYLPSTPGMHPGILLPLGHWEQGKSAAQIISANLALRGFIVLAYDPIGQGEREQAYDKRTGKSLAGGSTEQHNILGAQALLVGQSFARYRIWDARRALDYLVSLKEVDPSRIGVTGCSGGGTITTYISALDDRVKVAAPACYMNSFQTLFKGPVGDAEQSPPGFLSNGLDQTDYVELFAPKPWLMMSTEQDFFTPAGAKQVYDEARQWYALWGAQEKIHWVVGPGGHGTPLIVRQAIYDWMEQWLKPGQAHTAEIAVTTMPDHELWATRDGQVSSLPGSRDLNLYIRESIGPKASHDEMLALLRRLLEVEQSDPIALKPQITNRVITLTSRPNTAGHYSGNWLADTRMELIGRNLPMAHVAAILKAVDSGATRIHATGESGVWALIAAALDKRIEKVWLDRTPFSLRAAFDTALSDNLHDAVVPGFARKWDLDDLVATIGPDRVIWSDPTDWMHNIIPVTAPYVRYRSADANLEKWTPEGF